MAYAALQVLTLLTMTAHAVFGCCWHHAHGEDRPIVETAARASSGRRAAADGHCCCGHHHAPAAPVTGGDPMPGDSCPHDGGGCDEGTCQYVASSSPKISGATAHSVEPAASRPVSAKSVTLAFDRVRFSGHAPPDPRGGHGVRTLTQVWIL
jgi:hypothetical protein